MTSNGQTSPAKSVDPKADRPHSPRMKIALQEVEDKKWVAEVIVALEKGSMEQCFIFESYDKMMLGLPIVLKEVKTKFYA